MPRRTEESKLLVRTIACQILCNWTRSPLAKWFKHIEVKWVEQQLRCRPSVAIKPLVNCCLLLPKIMETVQETVKIWILHQENSRQATLIHTRTRTTDVIYQQFSRKQSRTNNLKIPRSHRKSFQCTRKWRTIKQKTSSIKLSTRTGRALRLLR